MPYSYSQWLKHYNKTNHTMTFFLNFRFSLMIIIIFLCCPSKTFLCINPGRAELVDDTVLSQDYSPTFSPPSLDVSWEQSGTRHSFINPAIPRLVHNPNILTVSLMWNVACLSPPPPLTLPTHSPSCTCSSSAHCWGPLSRPALAPASPGPGTRGH